MMLQPSREHAKRDESGARAESCLPNQTQGTEAMRELTPLGEFALR